MKIAFTGRPSLGGVRMRGVDVAEKLGVEFIDVRKLRPSYRFDVLILVKYWVEPITIRGKKQINLARQCCDRLIYDPLDPWSSWEEYKSFVPKKFWKWVYHHLQPDDIIATSPACEKTMKASKQPWHVHMLPHHADPQVKPGWHSPMGPVVYAGGERFIRNQLPQIEAACRKLGKQFVINVRNDGWQALRGASLCLHPRLPPHDVELNRHCKPQIKMENAAAAGLPMLATDDPCVTSLRPDIVTWKEGDDWAERMQAAIEAGPVRNPVTLKEHSKRIMQVLETERCLVN